MDVKLEEIVPKFEEAVLVHEKNLMLKDYVSSSELEEKKIKNRETTCVDLELEIVKKNSEYEALETKFRALESEKLTIERELMGLKSSKQGSYGNNEKVGEGLVGLTGDIEGEDYDKVTELEIENKVLDCEKKRAESDVAVLKGKCMGLESEVDVWKGKCTELESEVDIWTGKYAELESEVEAWKGKCVGLELRVLVCEKKMAESEVEVWKGKCRELVKGLNDGSGEGKSSESMKMNFGGTKVGTDLAYLQSKEKMGELRKEEETICDSHVNRASNLQRGSPHNDTPSKYTSSSKGENRTGQIKKRLAFDKDKSPCKKIAPSTPGSGKPGSCTVIDICDTDEENDNPILMSSLPNVGNKKPCISTAGAALEGTASGEGTCDDNVPFTRTPKRKRQSNIVASDSEDDDNVPVGELKQTHLLESPVREMATPRRRRLVRKSERDNGFETFSSSKNVETKGIPTMKDLEDDESQEDRSDSESDGLKDFIVESDATDSDTASSKSSDALRDTVDGADSLDDDETFGEILSKLKRSKDDKMKWEFEADMLAAFGKDHELCMKAVCALYRQQTSDEQVSKEALHNNGRGFSKFDAFRGSTLARFMTDGDPQGELKKSVEELQAYNSKGIELCRTFATRYSKQLFEIFMNKEDPLFHPS